MINLQLFDESRAALLRNAIADYLEVGATYELMGTGFTSLNESPGAQQTARPISMKPQRARTSQSTRPSFPTRAA